MKYWKLMSVLLVLVAIAPAAHARSVSQASPHVRLRAVTITTNSVALSWRVVGTRKKLRFIVLRNDRRRAVIGATTYIDKWVDADSTYTYRVRATTSAGKRVAISNELSVETPSVPQHEPAPQPQPTPAPQRPPAPAPQ